MKFEFICKGCGKVETVLGVIGETPDPPPRCDCGGQFRRLYRPLGTRFRCSGFYQTDKILSEPEKDM